MGLQKWLSARVGDMQAADPYRPPLPAELEAGVLGLRAVLAGEATDSLAALGFTVSPGVGDGRPYTLVADGADTERSWGAVVLPDGAPRLVVEVPHPKSDLRTAQLGLELFRAVPGSALLLAGAHRHAGGGAADVAHRTDSMFHVWAAALAAPEVQVHGYAAASLPGVDAVASAGAGSVTPAHEALRDALVAQGFRVCAGWVDAGGELEGTTNVQGIAATERGTPFLHLELAPALRTDPAGRAAAVAAIAGTWP
ncbi:MAG: hypothetical protein GEV28_25480 [Actinophytocola sp.]|uniref:hypothetical protein n=1 Tax=Actinophytocola sp. TaxID=1872138 RepID=UPI0013208BA2|nr:hypothetical protein [Actinophytocola sp.]MPZ83562.1 hypothetical protein [Actinophytocola sp.]